MSLLNPRKIVELGIVRGMNSEKQIQPNAIEMTADRIFKVDGKTWLLTEDDKEHRESHEIFPNADGVWVLDPNSVYDVMSNLYTEVPEGMAALVNIRSTLNRAGIRLSTGVWDSGFKGNLGAILHTPSGCEFELGVGTRIAQVLFFASDSEGTYAGGYNLEAGKHWTEGSKTGRMSAAEPNQSNTPKSI